MKLPHRIKKDLEAEIRGDVVIDDAVRHVYATAACIYRILPLAVARPRDADDVAAVVRYAAENSIPITPRGGGSGVAGHSVGSGIILDVVPYMRSILDEGDDWIDVEPGIVLDKLNAHLAPRGMRFAPDPSSSPYCTLGGMIANNSSGARRLKFGSIRNHIAGLELVTASSYPDAGQVVNTDSDEPWVTGIKERLKRIISVNREIIDTYKPKVTKNSSGYELWDVFGPDGNIDIARAIVGSEGTFGIVTRARLKILPIAPHKGVVMIALPDLEYATAAVPSLRETGPSAIEILDDSFLEILRNYQPDMSALLPPRGHCLLLVEHEAENEDELRAGTEATERAARKAGASSVESALDRDGVERLWYIRKAGSPIISSMPGPKRPVRFVEDMVVPPERFADFVSKFTGILRKYDCVAPVIGHAGDGNVHVNPILDLTDPAAGRTLKRVADEVYGLVNDFDGSLSGEHGDGRLRAPYLRDHFGPVYGVFEEIKRLFDPKGVLNPGVILGDGDITDYMRPVPLYIDVGGGLDRPGLQESLDRCHGCGLCRSVCPIYEVTGLDEYSPRGRVALSRSLARGEIGKLPAQRDPTLRRLLETCIGCARCDAGCPTGVGAPAVISNTKACFAPPARIGLADTMLANPRRWMPAIARSGAVGQMLQRLARPATATEPVARALGLNPGRPAPIIGSPSLKTLTKQFNLSNSIYDVIYFPGCYATFVDPEETGIATIRVLEAVGMKVFVASFACCGLPMSAAGDHDGGREALAAVIEAIESARNVPIVTSCPSCAMMLKGGAFGIEPLPGQQQIASRVVGIEAFLLENLKPDQMKPLKITLKAAHHVSCHQLHLGDGESARELLGLVPGLELDLLPNACCGMGGTFGLRYRNREFAGEMGKTVLDALKSSDSQVALSSCGSCRIALATVCPTLHPVSVIAQSIGVEEK